MRLNIFFTLLIVLVLAAAASAQNKISGTLQCGKPDPAYTILVGDRTDHAFVIGKFNCTWTKPLEIGGIVANSEEDTLFEDASGNRVRGQSRNVQTMANGDKYYIRTQFTGILKEGAFQSGEVTWTITGGTEKLKGLKGKGTSKLKAAAADGSSTWDCEGEYELPKVGPGSQFGGCHGMRVMPWAIDRNTPRPTAQAPCRGYQCSGPQIAAHTIACVGVVAPGFTGCGKTHWLVEVAATLRRHNFNQSNRHMAA
jgi:hypothetical protein